MSGFILKNKTDMELGAIVEGNLVRIVQIDTAFTLANDGHILPFDGRTIYIPKTNARGKGSRREGEPLTSRQNE